MSIVVSSFVQAAVAKPKFEASLFPILFYPVSGCLAFGEMHMKNFASKIVRFLESEDGPTAVEYAVMLALIVVVCLTAITSIGTNATATFDSVATQLSQ